MELLSYNKITVEETAKIYEFLTKIKIYNISKEIKETAIQIRKCSSLKLPDSIIAATTIANKICFVTGDKQFRTIENLDLVLFEK